MKRFGSLLVCALLIGCVATRVESLAWLAGQREATAYYGRDTARTKGVTVTTGELPEVLVRATWVDTSLAHKGGIWLRFRGGRDVFIPYGFEFFVVDGTPGHFEIRREDFERYHELAGRVQQAANKRLAEIVP